MPGGSTLLSYAGLIKGPVKLQLAEGVVYEVPLIRVIKHAVPLLLLGSDVLKGGRPEGEWNWAGLA